MMGSAPTGALYPGVLSTGLKSPEVEYRGDAWTLTKLSGRVDVAPTGQSVKFKVKRNGSYIQKSGADAEVEITAGNQAGEVTGISVSVSDKDYFQLDITQVGTTPNEGSDLHWQPVP